MTQLLINSLHKSYGKSTILKGISLSVKLGKFIALLGPSGSGKTTILRCLAGLETPDQNSGEIELDGVTFFKPGFCLAPEKRGLGMVFQSYAVWPHMTIYENVAFPLTLKKIPGQDIKELTQKALELVKLQDFAARLPHTLSGGQQQRVALARAIVTSPKLMLLDEPLSNLDSRLRDELGSEIRRLQRELKFTAILVTHDQREAIALSDEIVLLQQGNINCQGKPENLYAAPPTDFAAEFLCEGQRTQDTRGNPVTLIPRRWQMSSTEDNAAMRFKIINRIYLGQEYEYSAMTDVYKIPIKFYCNTKISLHDEVYLKYL